MIARNFTGWYPLVKGSYSSQYLRNMAPHANFQPLILKNCFNADNLTWRINSTLLHSALSSSNFASPRIRPWQWRLLTRTCRRTERSGSDVRRIAVARHIVSAKYKAYFHFRGSDVRRIAVARHIVSAKYKAYFHFRSIKSYSVIPLFRYSVIPYSVFYRLPLEIYIYPVKCKTMTQTYCQIIKRAVLNITNILEYLYY